MVSFLLTLWSIFDLFLLHVWFNLGPFLVHGAYKNGSENKADFKSAKEGCGEAPPSAATSFLGAKIGSKPSQDAFDTAFVVLIGYVACSVPPLCLPWPTLHGQVRQKAWQNEIKSQKKPEKSCKIRKNGGPAAMHHFCSVYSQFSSGKMGKKRPGTPESDANIV